MCGHSSLYLLKIESELVLLVVHGTISQNIPLYVFTGHVVAGNNLIKAFCISANFQIQNLVSLSSIYSYKQAYLGLCTGTANVKRFHEHDVLINIFYH